MSSVADIKTATVTAIGLLSLTPTPAVSTGKTAVLPSGKNPPAIRVACSRLPRTEVMDATRDIRTYGLAVALYVATPGTLGDDETIETWRQAINAALNTPNAFSMVTGFNEIQPLEGTPFVGAGLESLHNVSILAYAVEVIESRN